MRKIEWKKLGYSFELPVNKQSWQHSHAMMPVVLEMQNRLRVFYTTRHIDGRSRISYYDVSKEDPTKILFLNDKPVLDVGPLGSFDDCGTVATFVIRVDDKVYLYYNGYNVRNTVPWSNSIGVAVSIDGGDTFTKMYPGPIMDRSKNDPYFTITPWIIKDDKGYHMWYTSGTGWIEINNKKEPVYNIKYANSSDGINWERDFEVAIPQSHPEESVARSSILKYGDDLLMWFIYRGSRDFRNGKDSYRIGFAKGNINTPTEWIRDDSLSGIELGPEKFDNMMQSYPFVIDLSGKIFMFYNGNSFGDQGILCAEMEFKDIKR